MSFYFYILCNQREIFSSAQSFFSRFLRMKKSSNVQAIFIIYKIMLILYIYMHIYTEIYFVWAAPSYMMWYGITSPSKSLAHIDYCSNVTFFPETPQLCIVFLIYKVVFKITLLKKKNISQVMTKDLAGIGKTIRIPFHITHLPSQFDMVQETKEICFGRWERFETYFYEANRPTLWT